MKLFSVYLFVALIVAAFASPAKLPTASRKTVQEIIKENGGCNVNLCFALDGSGSISFDEYELEKNFVLQVVVALAGNPREVAAVQYGLDNLPISPLTDDISQFLLAVNADLRASAPVTFIAGGIAYCQRQLRNMDNDANKIVVIGDGRSNFGGNPVPLADTFRTTGGEICSVGIDFDDTKIQTLIGIANGSENVFTVQNYQGLFDIIDPLVLQICGIEVM